MKKIILKKIYTLLEDIFISSFFLLLGSGFLEFFYPGSVSLYLNSTWLFGIVFFFGMVSLGFKTYYKIDNNDQKESKAQLILTPILYFLASLVVLLIIWKLFTGLLFLQIIISFILLIIIALVYSDILI